jgi:ADP-dependent NAD(P)H-hydrate dehydratase
MKTSTKRRQRAMPRVKITPGLLRRWPLPSAQATHGKEDRGQVLIVGGSRTVPGAAVLAAIAALRAGAGKLQSATTQDVSRLVALALPEAMVLGLPNTATGEILGANAELRKAVAGADAILIGPGMRGGRSTASLVHEVIRKTESITVLDAGALEHLDAHGAKAKLLLTPHAGEMATLLDMTRNAVENNPLTAAVTAAERFNAVTVLKGATTYIASPDGSVWVNEHGNPGLGTSGSGDVLGGLIAGLAARGASAAQAAVWGVFAHARAGEILARSIGAVGFLAREITTPIPRILTQLSGKSERAR